MTNIIPIGTKFGHWTVIGEPIRDKNGYHKKYLCECDCEKHTQRYVDSQNLKRGKSISCGCVTAECTRKRRTKHGEAGTRLFYILVNMKERCFNPNSNAYKNYGERGIVVCQEWMHSYECFRDWELKNGYSDDLTIDRIDVNGNYEPTNCRWATNKEQCNNKRNNQLITYNGETHNTAEWSDILGIKKQTLQSRIDRGYPIEDILFCGFFDTRKRKRV